MRPLRVAFLGNFQPGLPLGVKAWSTETHLALSFEALGHEVTRLQEGEVRSTEVPERVKGHDLLVWVQTFGLAETGGTREERFAMLDAIRAQGIPSAAVHLDRWFGLQREVQVAEEPFFRCDIVATADGGHDDEFQTLGIDHYWLPPAVFHGEAFDGTPNRRHLSEVAFVGSWRSYGHPEWEPYRLDLLARLFQRYRRKFRCWPQGRAIRGTALTDLYASISIAVGDSCLAGSPSRYASDRVFEGVGRGCFTLHPHVDGVFPELLEDGKHLRTWPLGDFDALSELIDFYLANPEERELIRKRGAEHVRTNHTYKHRMAELLNVMHVRGLL